MNRLKLFLSSTLLLGACTGPSADHMLAERAQEPRQCFFGSEVSGFTERGEDRVLVRMGFREGWELTVSPGCPDVDGATKIGIVSRGSNRICEGQPAELLVPRVSGSGFQRCLVRNVRRLSEEEFRMAWGQVPRR